MINSARIKYFEQIPIDPGKDRILSRLGYRKGVTNLEDSHILMLDDSIKQGSMLCKPSGAYLRLSIREKSDDFIILENGVEFVSKSLSLLLKDSIDIILMASTVGNEIVDFTRDMISDGDAARGLILDAVGSVYADYILDWMNTLLGNMLVKEGKKLTKHRYSPGFGDLALENQKTIFDALELRKLNMNITQKCMLIPEKSVIAIIGVEENRR